MNELAADFPDFSGKCLSISLIDDDTSCDLFDPHFENQCGRIFIVGTIPPGSSESDWNANCKGAVAWDRVQEYVIFDDLGLYTKAVKKSEDYHSKKISPAFNQSVNQSGNKSGETR